jgi:transcriptional regulator with XRE-family HTH domain
MTIRLKDIANELGLSVVTLSKVLRNHPDIGAETRKRVLKRMRELNYQPNFAARSLVTGRTWTLGLVVPDLLHPFLPMSRKPFRLKQESTDIVCSSHLPTMTRSSRPRGSSSCWRDG